MSKITKLCRCVSRIVRNQWMTVLVFFHWLSCKFSRMYLFILTKISLFIVPSSLFAGLISLTVELFWKFSLWSFSDIKQLCSPFVCIPFKSLLLQKTCFLAAFIFFLILLVSFLYDAVIESFSIFWYSSLVKW